METTEIKILFETYENEDSFIKNDENSIETLFVSYFVNQDDETVYLLKFKDIGLDSKFGEIKIVNKNGFWEWLTNSSQINLIKNKIIEQLILQNI
jgi:hypothetical protein